MNFFKEIDMNMLYVVCSLIARNLFTPALKIIKLNILPCINCKYILTKDEITQFLRNPHIHPLFYLKIWVFEEFYQ